MSSQSLATSVRRAYPADLDAAVLYRIVRLRMDVFVVEQQVSAATELDGRDLEETTRHFWIDGPDGTVLAYLRLLEEKDGTFHIGRVCTAADSRGRGLAKKLMRTAVAEVGRAPVELSAQVHAMEFYRSFGFTESGDVYDEEGIPHILMRKA